MATTSPLKQLTRPQSYIRQRNIHTPKPPACAWQRAFRHRTASKLEQEPSPIHDKTWEEQAHKIKSGAQKGILQILEERGFVKDVAGGRKGLEWLLNEERIGAYVGVDPTAPSLHVGHLLPLMILYWMHLYGFPAITLLGDGTVMIGDPSGRMTARKQQAAEVQHMNMLSMAEQLKRLWVHVKALGIKHQFPKDLGCRSYVLRNSAWLKHVSAIDLMRNLGSGMRLGSMLARDSVKMRMESGEGMAISEFSYPLFQAYDWWHMYANHSVQLQIGGSDQYGNICAGMDAVSYMRRLGSTHVDQCAEKDLRKATFGLTTPLLTTTSGEKFGKSAGNAVWLDQDMLSSYDLYQYFLRTADDDVERYLKLFTFLPLDSIHMVMEGQRKDAAKRNAQHLLARQVVELAHGAAAAKRAESTHKEAFLHGTNMFPLTALREVLSGESPAGHESAKVEIAEKNDMSQTILAYKKEFVARSTTDRLSMPAVEEKLNSEATNNVVVLPHTLLQVGSFPQILHAAGLVSSKSEGHRLIRSKGAYVVLPNSGSAEHPNGLQWSPIPENMSAADPNQYLVDWEALVLRSGKSKIQICRIIEEERFEKDGLSCPGWDDFKAKRGAASTL